MTDRLDDDTVRLLAKAISIARGLNSPSPGLIFEALSVDEQLVLEREAVVVIREGDPLAQHVALHRAAAQIGVSVERMAEGLLAYTAQLAGGA